MTARQSFLISVVIVTLVSGLISFAFGRYTGQLMVEIREQAAY